MRSGAFAIAVLVLVLASAGASDANTPKEKDALEAVKPQLVVLGTPDGRYLAVAPELDKHHVYYGGRRVLHRQKVLLSATDEDDNFSVLIWAPAQVGGAAIEQIDNRWQLRCGTRITRLAPVGSEERALLLKTARFEAPRLDREPYALARNRKGEYFYVDRAVGSRGSEGFRLYSGRIGKTRRLELAWVVSDSEGDVFATRRGKLRITADEGGQRRIEWRRGKAGMPLLAVPITRNPYLIYKELGVYQNQQLGTPCDGS